MKKSKIVLGLIFLLTAFASVNVCAEDKIEPLYTEDSGVKFMIKGYSGYIKNASFTSGSESDGYEVYNYPLYVATENDKNQYLAVLNYDYEELNFYLTSFYHYKEKETDSYSYDINQFTDHLGTFPIPKGKMKNATTKVMADADTPVIIDFYNIHSKDVFANATDLNVGDDYFDSAFGDIKKISKPYAKEKTGYISILVVPKDFDFKKESFEKIGLTTDEFIPSDEVRQMQESKSLESDIILKINDKKEDLSFPILNINGRTLYPLRECLDLLNAETGWEQETRTAVGTLKDTEIRFTIDSEDYTVNGQTLKMDSGVTPIIYENKTYIPIRAVTEAFGFEIIWEEESRAINIITTE